LFYSIDLIWLPKSKQKYQQTSEIQILTTKDFTPKKQWYIVWNDAKTYIALMNWLFSTKKNWL
jgi:hypothetical protein